MPQDRLDSLIVNPERVEVCRKSAPEGMPAVPFGKGSVPLEQMTLGLVLGL